MSTIHSAKGQEWSSVFVLNVVDGCIPSDLAAGTTEEIEEERRLLYVAMTRAKNHLDFVVPKRFYISSQRSYGDRHMYATRSRFLPDGILPFFQCRSWPTAERDALSNPKGSRVATDIGARLQARWS